MDASATSTTVFTFNYGILVTPTISPVGGHYHSGQAVTISADTGGQVRYTLDGSDPNDTSTLYTSPVVLHSGAVTLKARAFRVDWTMSASTSQNYTISDDFIPPTITATLSPDPNAVGWYASNVTVTFTCVDGESAVAACTQPITVTDEGADIPVTGGGSDVWGNSATLTVTVNIDRSAPVVNVFVPVDGLEVEDGSSEVTLRGGVYDVSGIASVSCDGVAATVTGFLFTCPVQIAAGTNVISVEAVDLVGHVATRDVTVLNGNAPAATSIDISPSTMTMLVGDSRRVFIKDNRGRHAVGGTWTIDGPSIVQISETDGVTTITALAAGAATVTVTYHELTAHASVTVVAGDTLSSGTILWSLSDTSSVAGVTKRGQVLRASSVDPSDDPENNPALFFIDVGPVLFDQAAPPARIRATTADGRQLWDMTFTDRTPQQVAADNNGGVVFVLPKAVIGPNHDWVSATIRRIDGRTGSITWEYIEPWGDFSDVAIHPDGTIYTTETTVGVNYLTSFQATTGLVSKNPLPQGNYTQMSVGSCAGYKHVNTPGSATPPIVREDGSVVLLSRTRVSLQIIRNHFGYCNGYVEDYSFTDFAYLDELAPNGVSATPLNESAGQLPLVFAAKDLSLLPDGHGGLLLANRHAPVVQRIDGHQVGAANPVVPIDGRDTNPNTCLARTAPMFW